MADPLAQTLIAEAVTGSEGHTVTAASLPASSPSDAGRRVLGGRYEILGLLGAGGMGNVYRARDRELDELVALKVLRAEIAGNAQALERFRREVKLARRVTHVNVARVFDIGDQDGEKFLTMEMVEGEGLGALVERAGRLPVERALAIAIAVCAGLGAAHAAGVIHRDLKPDNVLLARDGRVVVTDFGIARAASAAEAHVTGTITGTPAYMAPEQVEGKPADARADIYAIGAMLYEILTGQAPWRGDSVFAIAAARLLQPPPDARAIRPELSPELAAVVLRCMAREPQARYASAEEVARELTAIAQPLAATATAPMSLQPASPRPFDPLALRADGGARKEVAVLPFRNAGGPDQEHLAEGLTEELIDLLSMARGLRVRSRGTVMRYRGVERDPREIGRELDVPVVVLGSVRREHGTVRIAVRLVSVADGVQIWHQRFDRPEADIFAVSHVVASAISEALTVQLSAPARSAPESAEAIDLYLRARSLYMRFFTDLDGESRRLFERALALAPDDPRILAGYAMAQGRLWVGDGENARQARRAAERAVERAPNLPEAHVAFAMIAYHERREPESIAALKRALRLSRFNAEAHEMLGRLLCETELQDEARKHLETALHMEPELQLTRVMLARIHMLRSDWEQAEATLESGTVDGVALLPSRSRMCMWKRDVAQARALLEQQENENPTARNLSRIMLETVANGTPPYNRGPAISTVTPRFKAFLYQIETESAMFLGDHRRALGAFEKADQCGVFDVAWADHCPLLLPLHGHDRFRAARVGMAARAKRIVDAYRAPEG